MKSGVGTVMKTRAWVLGWMLVAASAGGVRAAEWFVATNGNDAVDGSRWATAKLTIQAGVDAASDGDTVWVGDGVYATGGRTGPGSLLTNRVVIDKPITVQSVTGPEATIIQGQRSPGGIFELGAEAVRCVYLGTNATLIGFTLTNGATRLYDENSGGGAWSVDSGVVRHCILTGNVALYGGGAFGGTLFDCTLSGNNSADGNGGGAQKASLVRCVIRDNFANMAGGGAARM